MSPKTIVNIGRVEHGLCCVASVVDNGVNFNIGN